jgi:hypothetical protein
MTCERGFVDVEFTLAPTDPPRVQHLRISPALYPDAAVQSTIRELASLVGSFDPGVFEAVADPGLNSEALRGAFGIVRTAYGTCRVGSLLGGDGKSSTRYRLECSRGAVDLAVALTPEGKAKDITFVRPPGTPCDP